MNKTKRITKEMLLSEVVEKYPKAAEILATKYGLHCIGCFAAQMETLEQGAMAHGMKKKEIKNVVRELETLLE